MQVPHPQTTAPLSRGGLLRAAAAIALLLALWTLAPAQHTAASQSEKRYDLVVVGGTPGGIACAVRGAREGLDVLLVNLSQHLGGMISGGIGVMDTLYEGSRAPILDQFSQSVLDYYAKEYGAGSPQYLAAKPGHRLNHPTPKRLTFEPHVAEKIITDLVAAEPRITVLKGYYASAVERAERLVRGVVLTAFKGGETLRVSGRIFVDASYEGDLAALAGVPYRVGREDRNEYGEPHAGRIFSRRIIAPGGKGTYPQETRLGALNLRPFQAVTQEIYAGSTGEGDGKVQAYHYRLCLTNDPNNRRAIEKPSNYNRDLIASLYDPYRTLARGKPNSPNHKRFWFQNFSGNANEYPAADWPARLEIMQRHRDFALGMVYFLQNDPSLPEEDRRKAGEWGLPKDEYVQNDNFPYELYVREARRIVGRYVFTEHDATLARGYSRAPVHEDSIAIAEWFMDSHEVSTERMPGSDADGKIILSEITRPSQIPYRTLLPKSLDNLLVPVCLSASHVGWGTIRLEPTWMHIGEAAGYAAALAVKEDTVPGKISVPGLQRLLVENGIMVSFFNDLDMKTKAPWVPAVQYLAARGFFNSYNSGAEDPLKLAMAQQWARSFGELAAGTGTASGRALSLSRLAASSANPPVTVREFTAMLSNALAYWNHSTPDLPTRVASELGLAGDRQITRGDACRVMYGTLEVADN